MHLPNCFVQVAAKWVYVDIFTKLPWPGNSESFRSTSTCLSLNEMFLILLHWNKARKSWLPGIQKSLDEIDWESNRYILLRGTGHFLSHPLWNVPSSLPRSQPSLVLLSTQDKSEREFIFLAASVDTGHPLQDLTHILLNCPASEPLRRAILGTISSIFDLWFRP